MRNNKQNYSPIYRDVVQYELNKIIIEYHDMRQKYLNGDIERDVFRKRFDEIKKEREGLCEGEEPVEGVVDYSMEQRMIDQEMLESLLEFDSEGFDEDLDECLAELEELL